MKLISPILVAVIGSGIMSGHSLAMQDQLASNADADRVVNAPVDRRDKSAVGCAMVRDQTKSDGTSIGIDCDSLRPCRSNPHIVFWRGSTFSDIDAGRSIWGKLDSP